LSAPRYAAASIAWSNLCRSVLNGNRDDQAGGRRACSDLSKCATRNLLFGGQTVSVIGAVFYAVARPRLILSNGDNAQDLGIVLTAYGIPRAGSMLLGGWLSDRLLCCQHEASVCRAKISTQSNAVCANG
jgi:hypothetical protein